MYIPILYYINTYRHYTYHTDCYVLSICNINVYTGLLVNRCCQTRKQLTIITDTFP